MTTPAVSIDPRHCRISQNNPIRSDGGTEGRRDGGMEAADAGWWLAEVDRIDAMGEFPSLPFDAWLRLERHWTSNGRRWRHSSWKPGGKPTEATTTTTTKIKKKKKKKKKKKRITRRGEMIRHEEIPMRCSWRERGFFSRNVPTRWPLKSRKTNDGRPVISCDSAAQREQKPKSNQSNSLARTHTHTHTHKSNKLAIQNDIWRQRIRRCHLTAPAATLQNVQTISKANFVTVDFVVRLLENNYGQCWDFITIISYLNL